MLDLTEFGDLLFVRRLEELKRRALLGCEGLLLFGSEEDFGRGGSGGGGGGGGGFGVGSVLGLDVGLVAELCDEVCARRRQLISACNEL